MEGMTYTVIKAGDKEVGGMMATPLYHQFVLFLSWHQRSETETPRSIKSSIKLFMFEELRGAIYKYGLSTDSILRAWC